VNGGTNPDPNVELLAQTFASRASCDLVIRGIIRGRVLEDSLSLTEAADFLDQLRYDTHRPTPNGWEGQRWKDVAAKMGIDGSNDPEGVLPFFRPPSGGVVPATPYSRAGPYAISAYLRLWKACLTRRARGLVTTDDFRTPWTIADLAKKQREQPRFYVGVRYGSGAEVGTGPLGSLPFRIRATDRSVIDGNVVGSWGSRNPGVGAHAYFGDQFFDYHLHGRPLPGVASAETVWRPAGDPGLILFYVIERDDSPHPTVAFGVALPRGGPDQFAARVHETAGIIA
jgi:hypothetical protein